VGPLLLRPRAATIDFSHPWLISKQKAPEAFGLRGFDEYLVLLVSVAEQLQQHQEQIDEVEIEIERSHDCLAAHGCLIVLF
jgi:hypothetical protein